MVGVESEARAVRLQRRPGLAAQPVRLAEVETAAASPGLCLTAAASSADRRARLADLQQLAAGVVFAAGQVPVGGRPVAGPRERPGQLGVGRLQVQADPQIDRRQPVGRGPPPGQPASSRVSPWAGDDPGDRPVPLLELVEQSDRLLRAAGPQGDLGLELDDRRTPVGPGRPRSVGGRPR